MKLRRSLYFTSILLSLVWSGCNDESGSSTNTDDKTCTGPDCGTDTECEGENCKKDEKTCTGGNTYCESDDACYDLTSDINHCGSCDNQCAGGKICVGGDCKFNCVAGETECSDGCRNLNNDSKNCETCGHDCNAGRSEDEPQLVCVEKTCTLKCPDDEIICDGNCVNPSTSKQYCGAENGCSDDKAGVSCGDGLKCESSKCVCEDASLSICQGSDGAICTNPLNDKDYCGCTAESAGVKCDGLEHVASGTCEGGACQIACAEHFDDCNSSVADGCETDLNTVEHCGSCDIACDTSNTKSASCEEGVCKLVCSDDAQMCGDTCKDLNTDEENCGWCDHVCERDQKCSNGLCTTSEDAVCDENGYMNVTMGKRTVRAYCIDSYEKLVLLRDAVNSGKKYPDSSNADNAYILTKDIEIKGDDVWVAIGRNNNYTFTGTFLGNGKTISGMKFGCDSYMGLFGYVTNSMIDGLDLEVNSTNGATCNYSGVLGGYIQDSNVSNIVLNGEYACTGYTCGGLFGVVKNTSFTNIKADIVMTASNASGASPHGGVVGDAQGIIMSGVNVKIHMLNKDNPSIRGGVIGTIKSGGTSYISDVYVSGKLDYDESVTISKRFGQTIGGLIGGVGGETYISNCEVSVDQLLPGNFNGGLIGSASQVHVSRAVVKGKTRCSWSCGGFIGNLNGGEISESSVLANVESVDVNGTDWRNGVGGFIGSMAGDVVIRDSLFDGKVESVFVGTGGFVGYGTGGLIENCVVKGNVSGPTQLGGFIGKSQIKIKNCVSLANVNGIGGVGGFAGSVEGNAAGTSEISRSVAMGNVSSTGDGRNGMAGGFAGSSYMAKITDCASFGDVSGLGMEGSAGGGFVSSSSFDTIERVYSSGNVSKFAQTGKFIGSYQCGTCQFSDGYYWKGSTSGSDASANGDIDSTKISGFDYISNVPMVSDRKLVDLLGENWVEVKCELKSGPGRDSAGEYTIPVPKGVESKVCL